MFFDAEVKSTGNAGMEVRMEGFARRSCWDELQVHMIMSISSLGSSKYANNKFIWQNDIRIS